MSGHRLSRPKTTSRFSFRPPLFPCCLGAAAFSAAALWKAAAPEQLPLPAPAEYALYTAAGVFLALAVWAVIACVRRASPLRAVSRAACRHPLLARLYDDADLRIRWTGYGSLAFSGILALSRLAAGWQLASRWLTVLAGYSLALCATWGLVLRGSRAAARLDDPDARLRAGWKTYRLCGALLVLLALTLLGVAVLIVREDNGFVYDGFRIFAVAFYDFYSLISSVVFLIRFHRRRSPDLLALRQIRFAASLVSMLSLQTAMLAAFGTDTPLPLRRLMNLATGSAVCLLLALTGLFMVLRARRQLLPPP